MDPDNVADIGDGIVLKVSEDEDNPHTCIIGGEDETQCLACALIEVYGEERRDEALELAAIVGAVSMLKRRVRNFNG